MGQRLLPLRPDGSRATRRDVELGADAVREPSPDVRRAWSATAGAGEAVFAFESPYIYCGIPDPMRRVPSVNGATLSAPRSPCLPARAPASKVAAEHSDDWQPLWSSQGQSGEVKCKVDFTSLAEARYRLRLRFVLEGPGATLKQFETMLWFMVSPHSLPALRTAGENRMQPAQRRRVRPEHPDADASSTTSTQRSRSPPPTRRTTSATSPRPSPGCCQPTRRSRGRSSTNWLPPAEGKMAWASVYTIIEGRKPGEAYDGHTARIEIADSPEGPWQLLAEKPIVEHPQGWHFGPVRRGAFLRQKNKGYVRLSARKGALGVRIAGHYVPADARLVRLSAGDRARLVRGRPPRRPPAPHAHRADRGLSHEYVVRCQYEPHDERITLRVPSARK